VYLLLSTSSRGSSSRYSVMRLYSTWGRGVCGCVGVCGCLGVWVFGWQVGGGGMIECVKEGRRTAAAGHVGGRVLFRKGEGSRDTVTCCQGIMSASRAGTSRG
jgi:hypothetical protein